MAPKDPFERNASPVPASDATDTLAAQLSEVTTHRQDEAKAKALDTTKETKALPAASASPKQDPDPIASQSKQPYAADEAAEAELDPQLLKGCDQELRIAWSEFINDVADKWLELDGSSSKSIEEFRSKIKTKQNRNYVFSRLIERYKQRRVDSGQQPSEEELGRIKEQIQNHYEEIMNQSIDEAFRRSKDTLSPENKRKEMNRVLRLVRQDASYYDLLGVEQSATSAELKAAWKGLATTLHPDKNNDKHAPECMSGMLNPYVPRR